MKDISIINAFAVIVPVLTAIFVYIQTDRNNKISIKKEYFDKMFFELMAEKFPINIAMLNMNNNKFEETQLNEMEKDIKTIIKRLSILKYLTPKRKIYEQIKKAAENVQDKISELYRFDISDLSIDEQNQKIRTKKDELHQEYYNFFKLFSKYIYNNTFS